MAWRSKASAALRARHRLALAVAVCLLVGLPTRPSFATTNNELNAKRLESTVRFLQNAQNSDGGFSANGNGGEPSNPEFTAWAAIALATAGINPQDQARPGGESAYGYLAAHVAELRVTTDFERVLLVVDAAGGSPQDFGGADLSREILARQLPEGGFEHEEGKATSGINDTIFAILSLSPSDEPEVQEARARALAWLTRQQNSDGSWPLTVGEDGRGNVDMTAAAVEALNAAGVHDSEAQRQALAFLRKAERPDGGFPEDTEEPEADTASTSWTVQAIVSAGEDPETWKQGSSGKEPLDYLESMQHEDGSIQSSAASDANPVWMTAYAAPAFSFQPLPPPPVPLEVPSSAPAGPGGAAPAATGAAEAGQGGESSSQSGDGVIAGGGGGGAELFSRPQPQSRGSARAGVRLLDSAQVPAPDRGAARRAPRLGSHDPFATAAQRSSATAASPRNAAHRRGAASAGGASGEGERPGEGAEIRGLLLSAPGSGKEALEPAAPGLRGAAPGGTETPWLAITVGALIVLLMLAGSQLERRRPRVVA